MVPVPKNVLIHQEFNGQPDAKFVEYWLNTAERAIDLIQHLEVTYKSSIYQSLLEDWEQIKPQAESLFQTTTIEKIEKIDE